MPRRYYHKIYLSSKCTNEIFQLIESDDIPITEFGLDRQYLPITRTRIDIDRGIGLGWVNHDWPVTIIRHEKTKSLLGIVDIGSERFAAWARVDTRKMGADFFSRQRIHCSNELDWKEVIKFVQEWVDEVKETRHDLWEQLHHNRELLDGEPGQNIENTPFTHDEQVEISARIKQAKQYVHASGELTSEQVSRIETRLDHAEEASKRIGRKDWLMMFNGAVFSLILTDTITPPMAQHIFTLVVHGLGHFFGYGGQPLHLPGP
jgi:hypothetical protein